MGKKYYKLKMYHLRRLVGLVKKKKLNIESYDDVPDEIRQQLYAEEQHRFERQRKTRRQLSNESMLLALINIHFSPAQSAQALMIITPGASPPLLPYSDLIHDDVIMIPDLPLDIAA